MPPQRRNDPDTDDSAQDLPDAPASGTRLRRLFGALLIGVIAAGLTFGIPYLLVLNHQVTQRFGQLRWQIPTRVYAQPLLLRPGLAMDAATLKLELDAAAYQVQVGAAQRGSYEQAGARWRINSRGFDDVDGRVAPRVIEVQLGDGRVLGLRDVTNGKPLKAARLDPARIHSVLKLMDDVLGPVNCLAALQPQLAAGHRVVLVSSMAHWLHFPRAEAYGASKAALTWFADTLRLDWEPKGR